MRKRTAIALVLVIAAGAFGFAAGGSQATRSGPSGAQQVGSDDLYTFKAFQNIWPAEMNDVSRLFFERWERENNIKIIWEMPPTANYAERLQIMMAGGDYPDVVNFMSHTDPLFLSGVQDGVIIPITEYVTNAPNLQKYTYAVSWDAVRVREGSDDVFMIPRTSIARNDGLLVRKDWLDNVGLELPPDYRLSLDQFEEILTRFTFNDPNRDGRKNAFGYTNIPGASGGLSPILTGAFDLLGWQKYDNQEYPYMNLMYSRVSDNYKRALAYTASLWKKGVIDPDWPLNRGSAHWEKIYRGEAGITPVFAGHVQNRQEETQKNDPNARMAYIVGVKNDQGRLLGTSGILGIWGGYSLTKTASRPERIVMAFDWMLSDAVWDQVKYGPEGVTYNVVNGEKIPTEAFLQPRWSSIFLRRNNDPSFFISLTVPAEQRPQLNDWLQASLDTFVFSADKGYQPPVTRDPRFIDAQDKLAQVITKIIVGDLPVASYDAALVEWYANGGRTYVEQMNAFLSR